ncbi:hypothetical protein ACFTXB_03185 [Streptomyces sp. NPDC057074]|uniref:hypothetical protein n=1 Tax=Streptomyces sp. NPDC057074 TaxID=3346015 RepID=UPI00363493D5
MCLLDRPVPGRDPTDGGGTRTADGSADSFAARMAAGDPKGADAAQVTVRTDIRDERGVPRLPPL